MVSTLPTTRDLFDRVKTAKNLQSAYAVAKYLGVAPNTARNWEKGTSTLDAESVAKVAEALKLDAGYVALCVAVERERNDSVSRAMAHYLLAAANG